MQIYIFYPPNTNDSIFFYYFCITPHLNELFTAMIHKSTHSISLLLTFILLFLLAAIPFWWLDSQALWLGDDFGYSFADSSLHSADGPKVTEFSQIPATQASHWLHSNGRFIVHCTVMFFTSIAGPQIFSVCNAIVFGLLAILFYRLILPLAPPKPLSALFSLLLLWYCIPLPGVTMLSLVAYAVNYLWTALFILLFLYLLSIDHIHPHKILLPILALFSASLQESFSIPVSAGLLLYWICAETPLPRHQVLSIILFWLGSIILFFAPGNLSHARQGGGLSLAALQAKNVALASDVMFSSLSLLALILLLLPLLAKGALRRLFRDNIILLTAIITALLLASVSYTAIRQLFAPMLFSGIIIGKILFKFPIRFPNSPLFRASIFSAILLIYAGLMAGAYIIRQYPRKILDSLIAQVRQGHSVIVIPENDDPQSPLFNLLFAGYNDEPLSNNSLHLLFDHYTKQGLSRLYHPSHSPKAVTTILPLSIDSIKHVAAGADTTYSDLRINTIPLTEYYSLALIPASPHGKAGYSLKSDDAPLSYERLRHDSSIIYILPAKIRTLSLTPKNN